MVEASAVEALTTEPIFLMGFIGDWVILISNPLIDTTVIGLGGLPLVIGLDITSFSNNCEEIALCFSGVPSNSVGSLLKKGLDPLLGVVELPVSEDPAGDVTIGEFIVSCERAKRKRSSRYF